MMTTREIFALKAGLARSLQGIVLRSPLGILRSVQCGALGLRMNIKDIIPTPTGGIGIVLNRYQVPFAAPRHWINRNPPQESNLLRSAAPILHALHQTLEVGRIAFAPNLHLNEIAVRNIFVSVNGIADFTKIAPKFVFLRTDNRELEYRQSCG